MADPPKGVMLTPPLAVAFVQEEAAKWPAGDFKFTVQYSFSKIVDGDERFTLLVIWSQPTAAVPVPRLVVNMTAEAWVTEAGPVLSLKCASRSAAASLLCACCS